MEAIFLVNSSSFHDVSVSSSLRAGPNAIVDLTQAARVSGSFSGKGDQLTNVSASYIVANTTASYAATASYALNVPAQSASSSWASSSISSSVASSASFVIPGATFYVVSGSDGIPPAYIEPYDLPIDPYNPPYKEGRMFYDTDFHNWVYYPESNFKLHIGKEVIWRIHNPYNTTLSVNTPVYISGSSVGTLPDAWKAIADGTGTKSDVVGIIRNDIPSGSFGYILVAGVIHDVNVGAFQIGDQIWLSPTIEGGLISTDPGQPYESVRIGTCQESGTSGSIAVHILINPPPANAYAGMTSKPTIIDNTGSFELTISSGSVNLYRDSTGIGSIVQYPLAEVTFSVPTSLNASFIYATTNGVTASYVLTSNFSEINGINKVPVATVYRADEDTHWMESDKEGLALANKLEMRLYETQKFAWESGFTLYSTGSKQFIITAGQLWYGATNLIQQEFDSRLTGSGTPFFETHFAHRSASQWTIPIVPDGTWNSDYYDNGINLVPLAPSSWSVNYFYRILGENTYDEDVFYLTSTNQYETLAAAQLDVSPSDIPLVLNDVSILVGRMIVQSGSSTPMVESAFNTNFGQSLVTQHNSLAGLQGGQGGEYYHMSFSEYTGTGTGVMVRSSNAILTGTSITNARLTGSLVGTSSWSNNSLSSISSSFAITASFALNAGQIALVSSSISSSWASASLSSSYAITASYVPTTFTRGGTIYDPLGIAGTAATASNIIVWRAPFSCTVTNVWGYRITGSGALVNARKNGIGTIATGSHVDLTSIDTWISASSLIAQSSSFVTGDKLEIMLISSSGYPTQIAIQLDITK